MIKIDGVDIPRIEYIDPVDGKVSILRVMKDGIQIWPVESGVPNIPTGIQLSEYEIVENIDWDYTKMFIGEGENANLVTLYFNGQDADITSVPAITDFVLDPFNAPNNVDVFIDRVEITVANPYSYGDTAAIDYTPGVNPLKDIDGHLLTALNDQALDNVLPEPQFDADYQTYLDRLTTLARPLPSVGQQDHQNQLVLDLKTAGVWSKADAISLFATDAGKESSKVNLYPPSLFECTTVGSVAWDENIGWNGDGGTGKIILDYTLNADNTNMQLNDACAIAYIYQTPAVSKYIFGGLQVSPAVYRFHIMPTGPTGLNSTASFNAVINQNFVGFSRDNSANINVINGDTITNKSNVSTQIPNSKMSWIGRDGSDASLPTTDISFGFIGASLTNTEIADLKTAIESYMIAIGSLMSSDQVDALLIDSDNNGDSNTTIDLSIGSQPRTSASDTAVANLISRNVTVITA